MFRNTSILLIVIYFGNNVNAQEKRFRFDYKYFPETQGWFKLHWIPANWQDARLRCHLEGAVLASPINPTIHRALAAFIWSNEILNQTIFIGIHATHSKGDYSSIEGIPLARIPVIWAKGEPNNLNDQESCLVMYKDGKVADVRCENVYPYFCFKKDIPMVLNECGTIDNGYKLDSRTGNCYKFHTEIMRWPRAYMTCAAEGGHLAIINSEEESQLIRDLFIDHPENSIVGTPHRSTAHIGFYDWEEHGTWRTIHGETIEEAGFAKFGKNQPDNATGGEFCGSVFRTGLFNDIYCNDHLVFICEKKPDSLL